MLLLRFVILIAIAIASVTSILAQQNDYDWFVAAELEQGRHWHNVEVLRDGRIMVIGGIVNSTRYVDGAGLDGMTTNTVEFFDPATNAVNPCAAMNVPHSEAPSVITPDGMVIVVGGLSGEAERGVCTALIEGYDVDRDEWRILGSMSSGRRRHAAVMLDDHRILIVGGALESRVTVNTAEIFDLETGLSTVVQSMPQPLKEGSFVMLDGLPTYIGGRQGGPNSPRQRGVLSYIAARDEWVITSDEETRPAISTGVVLEDGSFITSGGNIAEWPANFSGKVYRFAQAQAEEIVELDSSRTLHAMVAMGRQTAMVSGGVDEGLKPLSSSFLILIGGRQVLVNPDHVHARAYHKLVMVDLEEEGRTFFAISGIDADQRATPTIEKLVIGSEQGLIASTTGVNEEQPRSLAVYPNPTTGIVHVPPTVTSSVVVMNSMGRYVATIAQDPGTQTIDLSALPGGLYLLHVQTPAGNELHKLIKH